MKLLEYDGGGYFWRKGDLSSALYLTKELANEDRENECIIWYMDGEERREKE